MPTNQHGIIGASDADPLICPRCNNVRKIYYRGRCAGPCPDCSFVLARCQQQNSDIWSAPTLLTYQVALTVLGTAIRGGASSHGQLSHGRVEYVAVKPMVTRWELVTLSHEEGVAWKAEHDKEIDAQNIARLRAAELPAARTKS